MDFAWLTRLAERGGRAMSRVPALDRAANAWVGMVEDAWTRITMPRLQMQLATAAEELEARTRGIEISHHGQGVNVAGLNSYKPLMAGEEPPTHRFSVLEDDGSVSTMEVDNWPQSRYRKARKAANSTHGASGLSVIDNTQAAFSQTRSAEDENEVENAVVEGGREGETGAFEGAVEALSDGDEEGLEGDDGGAGQGLGAPGESYQDRRMRAAQAAIASGADLEEFCREWGAKAIEEKKQVIPRNEFEARRDELERKMEERERAQAAAKSKPVRWDPEHARIGIDVEVIEPAQTSSAPVPATDPGPATEPQHAAPSGGAPTTTQPSSERPNRYASSCVVCGGMVPAGKGLMSRRVDKWIVRHQDCRMPLR
jgi:hypothetical protein